MQNQNGSAQDLWLKLAHILSQLICHEHFVPMHGQNCYSCENVSSNDDAGHKKTTGFSDQ